MVRQGVLWIACMLALDITTVHAGERLRADLNGDLRVDWRDFAVLADEWLLDNRPPVQIRWFGHTSFKIWQEDLILYVDPQGLTNRLPDAALVLVSHTHSDHFSPGDIAAISHEGTQVIGATDVIAQLGYGQALLPGQVLETAGVTLTGVPAYNINKSNHPRANNWLGFIIEIGGMRIYYAGDTDMTEEMKALEDIDVAILPVGGTYSMTAAEAAAATRIFKPALSIPSHWGRFVGSLSDATLFASQAYGEAIVLMPGDSVNLKDHHPVCPVLAHWGLNETTGTRAYDFAGAHTGILNGDAAWFTDPNRHAILLDGAGDYLTTDLVINPARDPFTVTAWVQTMVPGRSLLAQAGNTGKNWLACDAQGRLRTDLGSGGRAGSPLTGEAVVTDGAWHHVALVVDNQRRYLYMDSLLTGADDREAVLENTTSGMLIGTSPQRTDSWQGLIDDLAIHGCALTAEEIDALK